MVPKRSDILYESNTRSETPTKTHELEHAALHLKSTVSVVTFCAAAIKVVKRQRKPMSLNTPSSYNTLQTQHVLKVISPRKSNLGRECFPLVSKPKRSAAEDRCGEALHHTKHGRRFLCIYRFLVALSVRKRADVREKKLQKKSARRCLRMPHARWGHCHVTTLSC